MIRELQLQRVNYEDMISLYMHHIFITINRYIKEGRETKNDTINDIERAAHYFKDNYNKQISVEQYAAEHLMSVNWFIHSFKNVMKVSPMQYIISLRLSMQSPIFRYPFIGEGILIIIVATHTIAAISAVITILFVFECIFIIPPLHFGDNSI